MRTNAATPPLIPPICACVRLVPEDLSGPVPDVDVVVGIATLCDVTTVVVVIYDWLVTVALARGVMDGPMAPITTEPPSVVIMQEPGGPQGAAEMQQPPKAKFQSALMFSDMGASPYRLVQTDTHTSLRRML